jgi:hypothetical protein
LFQIEFEVILSDRAVALPLHAVVFGSGQRLSGKSSAEQHAFEGMCALVLKEKRKVNVPAQFGDQRSTRLENQI